MSISHTLHYGSRRPPETVELRSTAKPEITLKLRPSVWNDLRDLAREASEPWHRDVSLRWVTSMVKDRAYGPERTSFDATDEQILAALLA